MKLIVPFGTRPEFIKLAPVVGALVDAGHEVHTVATGQHFDPGLTDVFFDEFGMLPDRRWVLDGSESERTGALLTAALDLLGEEPADAVLLLGDTNTVPLFTFAARRHRRPVVHLEAGLRSGNETSIEEVNRRLVAAVASLHLAPTERAAANLLAEGVDPARVRVVGNPVLDAARISGVGRVPLGERRGVVVTLHRATNVDDPDRLAALLDVVCDVARRVGGGVLPLHPRTRHRLDEFGLWDRVDRDAVEVVQPLAFTEMLRTIARSALVVTDSGGLQEEAAWFGVPCVVLRPTTPRWEGVDAGIAAVTGADIGRTLAAVERFCDPVERGRIDASRCPYGDGRTAERVTALLASEEVGRLLTLVEPEIAERSPVVR